MKKVVISTGGGDAPGLNAVIYAVVHACYRRGWEVYGSRSGYAGFLDSDDMIQLSPRVVDGIYATGGTILGSTNKEILLHGQLKTWQVKFRLLMFQTRFSTISGDMVLTVILPSAVTAVCNWHTALPKKVCRS